MNWPVRETKGTSVYCLENKIKAKQIKALVETKLISQKLKNPLPENQLIWTSIGLKAWASVSDRLEFKSTLHRGVPLARLPYWKSVSSSVKWNDNHIYLMGLLWELNERKKCFADPRTDKWELSNYLIKGGRLTRTSKLIPRDNILHLTQKNLPLQNSPWILWRWMSSVPVRSPHVYSMPSAPILLPLFLNFRMLISRNLNSNTTHVIYI